MISEIDPNLAELFAKERVTILVTDSGLGGLAIFAEMAARFQIDPIFSRARLIYFNAWPEQDRGYNGLKDMAERIRVFDCALKGMLRYEPDIILIACNTLSVLYPRTPFSRREVVPVIDIVRFGVDMVHEKLEATPNSVALLLGTVTTIASDVHRSALIDKGISAGRLISQPCDQLATQIEKGPDSDVVKQMIDTYISQAGDKIGSGPSEVYAALFCTHFGYSRSLIREKLQQHLQHPVTILDPNLKIAAFLFDAAGGKRYEHTDRELKVVSRIVWSQTQIDAVSKIVAQRSPETAAALKHYEWDPDLFTF